MSNVYINLPEEASPRWKAPVANAGSLPPTGNTIGDARIDKSTSTIYVWDGTAWLAVATPGAAIAIDGLTGDVIASGPGVVAANLVATTNSTLVTLSSLLVPVSQVTGGGNLTDVGTDGIVITNGTGAVLGSGTSIAQHVADATHNGYLNSTDWSTFNNKQPAGTYVTSISVATANGFAGLSSGGATPTLTLSTSITGILQGNGTAISAASTTGSGAVVLATSPTLVTPALGTPTALVGTNITGTGSGFTAGNINATTNNTITTLSALSLPAAQLTGKGNLTDVGTDGITITGGTGAVIGTGTSIAQQAADATHNGYLSSTDWSTFNGKVGGASNLTTVGAVPYVSASGVLNQDPTNFFWDATNHRHGLGTNAPAVLLDVLGTARIGSGPTSVTTLNGAITAGSPATGGALTVTSTTTYPTAGTLAIGTEAITYTGISGNTFTGITRGALGTTAASALNAAQVNFYLESISVNQTDKPKFVVTGNGNVGVGTATPSATLHVISTGAAGVTGSSYALLESSVTNGSPVIGFKKGVSRTYNVGINGNGNNEFAVADVTNTTTPFMIQAATPNFALFVASTIRVGIGTNTPGAGLDVSTTGTGSAIIVPRDTTVNQPVSLVNGMVRYNTTTALFEFYQNGGWVNYTVTSDARLKTNVTPVTGALGIVDQLNPVYFDWDQNSPRASSFGTKHQVGFIAQEVETILPEAVNQGEDTYRTLETDKILSIAIAAIKELHTKTISQDAQIEALTAAITVLNSGGSYAGG